jgi:hypothetical protein
MRVVRRYGAFASTPHCLPRAVGPTPAVPMSLLLAQSASAGPRAKPTCSAARMEWLRALFANMFHAGESARFPRFSQEQKVILA